MIQAQADAFLRYDGVTSASSIDWLVVRLGSGGIYVGFLRLLETGSVSGGGLCNLLPYLGFKHSYISASL
jgi:hypothetical protein